MVWPSAVSLSYSFLRSECTPCLIAPCTLWSSFGSRLSVLAQARTRLVQRQHVWSTAADGSYSFCVSLWTWLVCCHTLRVWYVCLHHTNGCGPHSQTQFSAFALMFFPCWILHLVLYIGYITVDHSIRWGCVILYSSCSVPPCFMVFFLSVYCLRIFMTSTQIQWLIAALLHHWRLSYPRLLSVVLLRSRSGLAGSIFGRLLFEVFLFSFLPFWIVTVLLALFSLLYCWVIPTHGWVFQLGVCTLCIHWFLSYEPLPCPLVASHIYLLMTGGI